MQVDDSQPNSFSYQAIPVYAMSPAQGLQPAATIYEPNPHSFVSHGLVFDNSSTGQFSMPRQGQGPMHMSSPFMNSYPHHPSNSVSLSAIQPFESCLPQSGGYPGPHDYSQYIMTSPPSMLAPDLSQPGVSPTPQHHRGSGYWQHTVMPVSLDYPYDIQGFYANSDGTMSDVWSSTFTPPMHQSARPSTKRSNDVLAEPSQARVPEQREKRQCLRVNTNLEPMLTPDSSPASSPASDNPSPPAEVCTPPEPTATHLRPRKPVDYLPTTPNTSPNDSRRAISAAARAQSITDHVLGIYRSYAKPKDSTTEADVKPNVDLPFIEGYEPVLPAFPELSGDEMMMSDDEDEPEKEVEESGNGKRKAGKKSPKVGRGQDKVSNRVAARRHREMTKERLKNLEKLRSWLDDALTEYEKSNRVLQNNFQQLQQENQTIRTVCYRDGHYLRVDSQLQQNMTIPVQQSS